MKMAAQDAFGVQMHYAYKVHETLLKSLQNIAKWCFQLNFGDENTWH
jgi:hypothetical protein